MFLTNKSFRKILIVAVCYLILGSVAIALWAVFSSSGIECPLLSILGIIVYLFCILIVFWGRYAEGKGKLINLGNRLVRNELKPAEFLPEYKALKESYVINSSYISKSSICVFGSFYE